MRSATIRTHLLVLVLAVTVPLVAIVSLAIYFDMQQSVNNTKNSLRTLTSMMATNTGNNISNAREILRSLAKRPLVKKMNAKNCDPILPSLLGMNPLYKNVVYTNTDGIVVCSALPQPGGKPANISQALWFQHFLKERSFYIGPPYMGPITGKLVSVINEPVWDGQHNLIGAVQLPVALDFYDPHIPTEFISDASRFGFFADDGVLIWRNRDPENVIGSKPNSTAAKQIVELRNGELENHSLDGLERYYSVAAMPEVHWVAYVGVPTTAVYAAAKQREKLWLLLMLFTVVLLVAVAIVIAKRISRPIMALEKVANAIRRGDSEVRARNAGPAEIASVALALNAMIETQQHSDERMNNAQHRAHLGSYEWDLVTGDLQWSDELYCLLGLQPQSEVATYALFRQTVHAEDIGRVEAELQHALHGENSINWEFRVVWPDHSIHALSGRGDIAYDAAGKPLRMLGTIQDVSERKQAETELYESEQRFRYMLETCPTAARIARKGGHDVIFFNRQYAALINVGAEQVQGVDPETYYADRQEYNDILERLQNGEQIFERLIELNIPGAGTKWALATYLQIYYQGGSAVLGWFHDITETIQVERLKTEFVSTVSHELRTPLTAISGALGLIAGGVLGAMPVQAKLMVDIAHKNSLRLNSLINDLLDIDKLVAGKIALEIQSQPLMPLVQQALEAIAAYGEQYGVVFKLVAQADVGVAVDGGRLIQVLNNFLSNAAKFSPAGSQVDIAVRANAGKVRVEVIDYGPGIPDEFRQRIFQKFSQADSSDTRKKGGTGLGLYISKELIERMGGSIGFDSIAGQGSCFYFELALADSAD